jgi:outer membrane protein insertion porin family
VTVTEKPTGNLGLGLGLSSTERFVLSASLQQANFLRTGRAFRFVVSSSRLNRQVNISLTEPYFTEDGISQSFDLFVRTFNAAILNLGNYRLRTAGLSSNWVSPTPRSIVSSWESGLECPTGSIWATRTHLCATSTSSTSSGPPAWSMLSNVGWQRDTRDSGFIPTRGQLQTASFEVTVPTGDLRYFRALYVDQVVPTPRQGCDLRIERRALASGVRCTAAILRSSRTSTRGGIGSVRGYYASSLGPGRDPVDNVALGGQTEDRAAAPSCRCRSPAWATIARSAPSSSPTPATSSPRGPSPSPIFAVRPVSVCPGSRRSAP